MNQEQDPFVRQWNLEGEAARQGAERLRRTTKEMESREYASGTIWGKKAVEQQVGSIAKAIEVGKSRIMQGKAAEGAIKLKDVLELIESEVLATIAAKKALDLAGIGKGSNGKPVNTFANVCSAIGRAVESEGRFRWYEHVANKEWKAVKAKYFKPTTGTRQKEIVSKTIMKRRGYEWTRWSNQKVHHVGSFLLIKIIETVNWLELDRNGKKGKDSYHLVKLNPLMENWVESVMTLAELGSPLTWPMVCEPASWTSSERGGYLTNELRQGFSLIRRQRGPLTMGEQPLNMLNTLQRVGYFVNPATFNLMTQLSERGWDLDSFIVRENERPEPFKEEWNEAERFEWRKRRTDQENRNAALIGKRYRTMETMAIADRFHKEEVIYIPWSFDYRGRVYPLVSFMSPQGTGMEKSLFKFRSGRPITLSTKKWLAIHLANTAGHDKLPMRERVSWVHQNLPLIERIATDPIGNFGELEGMDDPWCFYAAADEFYHCVIKKDRTETTLPVATDATCSGLQHLSAMTLDGATGALVNVAPGAKPQDAYKAVLHKTLELLRESPPELQEWGQRRNAQTLVSYARELNKFIKGVTTSCPHPPTAITLPNQELADWGEKVGRKLTKRVVMTVPYAATPHSNRGYIKEAIEDYEEAMAKAVAAVSKRRPSGAELSILTHVMLTAMTEVVPGPIAVMEWIKANVGAFFSDKHDGAIEWHTPSGFPVKQDKRHLDRIRIKTMLLGELIKTWVSVGVKGVNVDKHKSSSAPNFIHSMDAALLHMSFAGFDKPFTLIHDSILTTATDMEYMSKVIREQFYELYKDHPLLRYADTIKAKRPDHLIKGDLQIEDVTKSTYFFC